jgi:hypothetical protein
MLHDPHRTEPDVLTHPRFEMRERRIYFGRARLDYVADRQGWSDQQRRAAHQLVQTSATAHGYRWVEDHELAHIATVLDDLAATGHILRLPPTDGRPASYSPNIADESTV